MNMARNAVRWIDYDYEHEHEHDEYGTILVSNFSRNDLSYMQMALTLAARGRGHTSPNPMVGAVVVKDGTVVGRGFHARAGDHHAEVVALREAGELAAGSTLYVTLEPCVHHGKTPPCHRAVIEAGVKRVVAAMADPNPLVGGKGIEALKQAGIHVEVGCLGDQARRLNEFFVTYHELGRPFMSLKWAMSLCGRTAHDSGQSRWISCAESRDHGHRLRALHDAVMVGIGTVLMDDPMLNVRLPGYDGQQPKRIVIDGDLSMPTRARLLRERRKGEVILFTTPFAKPAQIDFFENEGCRVIVIPSKRRIIDLQLVVQELHRLGVMSVLVEGGRQIHTALIQKGLADKVHVFLAPKLIGGCQLRNPVEDLGIGDMDHALMLNDMTIQNIGTDICIEGYLRKI
ncbi:bifunctional diaminohydroxyphosphoribosylaminopyrimidine deaminase/5-amino-6-(5-phosphoribosylamino)uracil reductase RibD [bacterium]|nr:bifunctional diaminohydroxyphosphoribosylaminopyrimidine deaminase/5-amino-6-(5-phosphoribosylamino)uracil reductase RibD [bacterium]